MPRFDYMFFQFEGSSKGPSLPITNHRFERFQNTRLESEINLLIANQFELNKAGFNASSAEVCIAKNSGHVEGYGVLKFFFIKKLEMCLFITSNLNHFVIVTCFHFKQIYKYRDFFSQTIVVTQLAFWVVSTQQRYNEILQCLNTNGFRYLLKILFFF